MTEHAPPTLSEAGRADLARAHRAARWVAIYLPIAVTLLGLALVLLWMPRLPNPVAMHWSGLTEAPDGFGPALGYAMLSAGLGFGLAVIFGLIVLLGGRGGSMPIWSPYQRFMGAFGIGAVVFAQVLMVGSVAVQLDLPDAREAPPIGGLLAVAFVAWAAVTAAAWFAQPSVTVDGSADPAPDADRIELAETERAVWVGETRMSKPFLLVMVLTVLVLLGSTILLAAAAGAPAWWGMSLVLALVVGLFACTTWFWVRVDADGLEVRSIVGWPVFRVPSNDIVEVSAARINPFAELGGWGLRIAPGRFGIAPRSGEGLVVRRRSGRLFIVTVDDADTAAALLATIAEGARGNDEGKEGSE